MWTGKSALKNIDQSLQTIRNDVVRLDTQLQSLSDRIAADGRHRLTLLEKIAAVRLKEIESGSLKADLTAADHAVAGILAERNVALSDVNQQIDSTNQTISQLESEREDLLSKVNETSQQIDDVETRVQTDLKNDDEYLTQLGVAREAESVAAEAQRKVEVAQRDMAEKAAPYQQDELFMYLWQRGFGTTEYRGGLFARFMDGWVARLIDFAPSRVNYWNLTEIPKRLGEHADRVDAKADQEHERLQQYEILALEGAGIRALEAELEQRRAALDTHDDRLEQAENSLNSLLNERAAFLAGDDVYMQRCLSTLTQAADHQSLAALSESTYQTLSPMDDQLVLDLRNLDARINDSRDGLREVRQLHDRKLDKLKELEKVRRDFKHSRFDDVRSGFGNEDLIASVLGQFLQGVVSGADLWRVLKRNQRYRDTGASPDFGSDGLGGLGDLLGGGLPSPRRRSRRRATWHWPNPRKGGGGFRLPRGGGKDGGGFTTGGGF